VYDSLKIYDFVTHSGTQIVGYLLVNYRIGHFFWSWFFSVRLVITQ